jgi:hypothetical protein
LLRNIAIPEFQWPPLGFFTQDRRQLISFDVALALRYKRPQHLGRRRRKAAAPQV